MIRSKVEVKTWFHEPQNEINALTIHFHVDEATYNPMATLLKDPSARAVTVSFRFDVLEDDWKGLEIRKRATRRLIF